MFSPARLRRSGGRRAAKYAKFFTIMKHLRCFRYSGINLKFPVRSSISMNIDNLVEVVYVDTVQTRLYPETVNKICAYHKNIVDVSLL